MKRGITLIIGLIFLQCKPDVDLAEIVYPDNIENPESSDFDQQSQDYPLNWPWRGINITSREITNIDRNKISELKALNINALRLTIEARSYSMNNSLSFDLAVEQNLKWCEDVIKWCADEGIVVIIESLDFPLDPSKKFDRRSQEFWESETELETALTYISELVVRFNKFENVVAYDFFSEPVVIINGLSKRPENWFSFFDRILATIRTHSNKSVIFTPGPWGLPSGYNDLPDRIDDSKVIYGFHFYKPHEYTHQGFGIRLEEKHTYPGLIDSKYWNDKTIEEEMQHAISWVKENGDKLLFAGEFSAVRWAEGKEQYLEDVLNIFEQNNIAYTYWCLNSWKGWDMDFEESKKGSRKLIRSAEKTKTRQLLEKYWQKNN